MKKVSSVVWQFFDRLEENKRCIAVLCKLCENEYKYFGNTTNLRMHLQKKHPIQWELREIDNWEGKRGDESTIRTLAEDENSHSGISPKRRKYRRNYEPENVDVIEQSDAEIDHNGEHDPTLNLVRQMHEQVPASDEEWLEETYENHMDVYEPKRMKYRKIKQEVTTPPRRVSTFMPRTTRVAKPTHLIHESVISKDEYSVFGEYIANKLRKFKAPRTRGNIQQLITTILWQAEYGMYDDADAVKRVLMCSVQDPEPAQQEDTEGQEASMMEPTEETMETREEDPHQSLMTKEE